MNAIRSAIYKALEADQPMTVRQVFYRLTSEGVIPKLEPEYSGTVVRLLGDMRRDGTIPYEWLADATRWMRKPTTYSSVEDALRNTAKTYRRDLWNDGNEYVEIWLEKEALAGVLVDVTDPWDVPLMVTRGYSSISYLHSAAQTIYSRAKQGKRTTIYYFGDRDPSGVDIDRAIRQGIGESLSFIEESEVSRCSGDDPSRMISRALAVGDTDALLAAVGQRNAEFNELLKDALESFRDMTKKSEEREERPPTRSQLRHERLMEECSAYAQQSERQRRIGCDYDSDDSEEQAEWKEATFEDYASFERVAVTEDQINDWGLQTRPTKTTDTRSKNFRGVSVELDAIPPAQLRQLAEEIINRHVDRERLKVLQLAEQEERKGIEKIAAGLGDGFREQYEEWAGPIGLDTQTDGGRY